jgi:EAL domain-containing protein (putative c-di-GMP-specific phosphodiesterase class I)
MTRGMAVAPQPLLASHAAARSSPARRLAARLTDRPGLVLAIGAVLTGLLIVDVIVDPAGSRWAAEDALMVVSSSAVVLALATLQRRPGTHALSYGVLAASLMVACIGLSITDLAPVLGFGPTSVAANVVVGVGTAIGMWVILPALYRPFGGRQMATVVLDGLIMWVAAMTILMTIWPYGPFASGPSDDFVLPVIAASFLASVCLPVIAALTRGVKPGVQGVWCGMAGVGILAFAWYVWIDASLGAGQRPTLVAVVYAVGLLVVAYGWMTWSDEAGGGRLYRTIAPVLMDWLPAAAIFVCVPTWAIPHARIQGIDQAFVGVIAVMLLTIIRQRLLISDARQANRRLAGEVEERSQTMLSLGRLDVGDTMELTAQRICAEALRLTGIDSAAIYGFGPSGVTPIALEGLTPPGEAAGEAVGSERAFHLTSQAGFGAWIDDRRLDPASDGSRVSAEAFAPMRYEDGVVGVVSMGSRHRDDARRLAERLPTLTEFGVVSAALLGPMMQEHWRITDVRSVLESVISTHAFAPVYQPVVRLADRQPVGYEALTRFTDGTRPDDRFMEAHRAGMSVRLEMASLSDQIDSAVWLPRGTWLSLNVSPSLATAVVPLVSALERADRDVVLEITEHVEIADYKALLDALSLVRGQVRLAVDDAGAGYAGLRHILELRPQFVKLDLSLVRNVDKDPARQAMVAGMAHFARNSGSELIAEGIETEEELRQLIVLGVPYGQGYLLGKPGRVA